jgi:hypothetical protein
MPVLPSIVLSIAQVGIASAAGAASAENAAAADAISAARLARLGCAFRRALSLTLRAV